MINLKIDDKTLADFRNHMEKLGKQLEKNTDEENERIVKEIFKESQKNVPVDTGKLKASGRIFKRGDSYVVEYEKDYAVYVHEKPGRGRKFLQKAVSKVLGREEKKIVENITKGVEE